MNNKIKSFSTSPNQTGIRISGSSLIYKDQNNLKQIISTALESIEGLPREKSAHLYSLHRELFTLRKNLNNDFLKPIIRVKGNPNIEKFISGYKRNALSSILGDTETLLLYSISRSINLSSTRLRALGIKVDSKVNLSRLQNYKRLIRTEKNLKSILRAFDRAEQHALDYAKEKITKESFRRNILDSSFTPTKGGSLTKAIQKIRRTEYQFLDHSVSRAMYTEHGVNYCYWRLSGNHKDYGGKEVCEVFANSTGSRASNSNLPKRGLYHINEFPSVPHPNCMCQMIPTQEDSKD